MRPLYSVLMPLLQCADLPFSPAVERVVEWYVGDKSIRTATDSHIHVRPLRTGAWLLNWL